MTEAEKTFIAKVGDRWPKAIAAATMVVRSDRRFIGLDKLRNPMIHRAAIEACGGHFPCPPLAHIATENPDLSRELNKLVETAKEAAQKAIG